MADTRPRWEGEMMNTIQPNPKACETCLFRWTEYNGIQLNRADTDTCQIFEHPESKPHAVLWDGADCEHYEQAV
jgi:hypothetical protein